MIRMNPLVVVGLAVGWLPLAGRRDSSGTI